MNNFIAFSWLVRREVLRFMRVVTQTILSPLVNAGLYLLVFGVSLSHIIQPQNGFSYLQFLSPGLISLAAFTNALQNSASSLMISKFHGDLQDLKVLPLTPFTIFAGYSFASMARGVLVGLSVLFLCEAFSFLHGGQALPIQNPATFLFFIIFGSMIFGNIGIATGFYARTFDHINAVTSFILQPLIYLGGVFFSLEVLPDFWQKIAVFNPLFYAINGVRFGILGVSDRDMSLCIPVLIVFVLVSSAIAYRAVAKGSYQRF